MKSLKTGETKDDPYSGVLFGNPNDNNLAGMIGSLIRALTRTNDEFLKSTPGGRASTAVDLRTPGVVVLVELGSDLEERCGYTSTTGDVDICGVRLLSNFAEALQSNNRWQK